MSESEYDRLRAVSPEDADLMEAAFTRDSWAPLARRLRELLEENKKLYEICADFMRRENEDYRRAIP